MPPAPATRPEPRPIRVLHFQRAFSALSETFIYDVVVELQRQGLDSRVLTTVREHERERPFDGVILRPLPPRWHPGRLLGRALSRGAERDVAAHVWPAYRRSLRQAVREFAPDVIHAHFGAEAIIAAPVARDLGVPLVAAFYGYDASRLPLSAAWRAQLDGLWRSAAAVTVLSREMRASLVALGCPESRLHVVRLAKDMGAYPFSARSGPVRSLVSVGRLVEKKGHLDAIRAVQLVARSGLPLHLRLVGEGPLRGEIEAFVRAERLETAVTLCGALPHPEVRREMAAANAFVLCSRTARDGDREGTPTVLLEAQALGLPVVSTRHAGIPEIVPVANHWLLAEEGDVAGIAAVLQRLAACGPEELRAVQQAGRAHVEAHHALPESVRQLRDVYAAVAGAAVHA